MYKKTQRNEKEIEHITYLSHRHMISIINYFITYQYYHPRISAQLSRLSLFLRDAKK